MATRSLNKVMLIGNLTRDPELRYTPQGTAVCTMGLATNRTWVTENGEKKEETEFHRIVAWNKLAELCSQLLFKGRRIYVEGRLQTRQWTAQDGTQRQATETVIEDMLILDSKRQGDEGGEMYQDSQINPVVPNNQPTENPAVTENATSAPADDGSASAKPKAKAKADDKAAATPDEVAEDIPF